MSDETSTPLKTCDNCKREISEANFVIHTLHCQRNIVLCKKCDTPFSKDEIEEHIKESHSKVACKKCGLEIEQQTLEEHNSSKCSKRMVICGFCNIEVPFEAQDEHEDYCGSRTERCDECGQYVMAKFLDIHLSSNHTFLTLDDATKPQKIKLNNIKVEPEAGSSRFSPGKRTNDMPQINLDREAKKNLEWKPVLQAAALPNSKLSMEESDRLLALQVAKEDAEEQTEDVFATDYRDDDPFAERDPDFYNDLNTFPIPRAQFAEPSAAVSTLARLSRNIGTSINRLFPNITAERQDECEETDDLSLPCEFCGELLPVDALLQHQATCEAGDGAFEELLNDEPRLLNNTRNSPEPSDQVRAQPLLDPRLRNAISPLPVDTNVTSTNEVMIPCEYCNVLYDSSLIIEHQNLCADTANVRPIVNPPRVSPQRYVPPRNVVRHRVLGGDRDDDLDDKILRDAIARSYDYRPVRSMERWNRTPTVRDVPIAVSPNYERNVSRQAQLEDVEKENALRQLRRLKAQLSNPEGPLVTSRRFDEPVVTQQSSTSTDARPNRDAAMGQAQRDQGFMFPRATPPNRNAYTDDYRRRTPNLPPTMNRRHI